MTISPRAAFPSLFFGDKALFYSRLCCLYQVGCLCQRGWPICQSNSFLEVRYFMTLSQITEGTAYFLIKWDPRTHRSLIVLDLGSNLLILPVKVDDSVEQKKIGIKALKTVLNFKIYCPSVIKITGTELQRIIIIRYQTFRSRRGHSENKRYLMLPSPMGKGVETKAGQ